MSSNPFKKNFNESDFRLANSQGKEFMRRLSDAVPTIKIFENESQSRTDIFDGSPGFNDSCDISALVPGIKMCFEITGDCRYLEKDSRYLLVNAFAVEKLLLHEEAEDGCYGFAVYYLAKENPTKFFVMWAKTIKSQHSTGSSGFTVRGEDMSRKYKIPVGDWYSLDMFIERLKSKINL